MTVEVGEGTALTRAAARAKGWLFDAALPLWRVEGVDEQGLFAESLDDEGRPNRRLERRVRVQARQLFVFSEAYRMGWAADLPLDAWLWAFARRCRVGEGEGWAHRLRADGSIADPTRDLYDHAFVLLALAATHRATGERRAKALAEDVLGFLDAHMAGPMGGYLEALPPVLPRRSNPHMHLLEALLAWRDCGWDEADARVSDVVELFRNRFFDRERGVLNEYFGPTWAPAAGAAGEVVEPGHHFEWIWLLGQADRCAEEQARLYAFAREHGTDAGGFAVDECRRDGRQTRRSRRAWPQTEMIKAQLIMGDGGDAAATVERVLDSYLATDRPGLWINQFDEHGEPVREAVPASTLYHFTLAFREVLAAAR